MSMPRLVAVEDMIEKARPLGIGEKLGPEAYQAARGYPELQPYPAVAIVLHLLHFSLSHACLLGNDTHKFFRYIYHEQLHWFVQFAFYFFGDCFRHRHRKFVSFPPHHFNQYGKLKLSPAHNLERIGVIEFDPYGDIVKELLLEPLAQVP